MQPGLRPLHATLTRHLLPCARAAPRPLCKRVPTFKPALPPSRPTSLCPHSPTPCSYVHRVGRTGRAGQSGTAISLLGPSDAAFAAELEAMLQASSDGGEEGDGADRQAAAGAAAAAESDSSSDDDEEGGGGGRRGGAAAGLQPHPRITRAADEGLRYRAEDVARSITKNVIKEAS